jgi:hypothetical protein
MSPLSPHIVVMEELHRFMCRVRPDLLSERRFRWAVCEGEQIHLRSLCSYATHREAEAEGNKAAIRVAKNRPRYK